MKKKIKIKVTPEGRPEMYLPDRDSLKKWIKFKGFKKVHNIISSGQLLLGADHDVQSLFSEIDSAKKVAILTGEAKKNNLGHALALIFENLEMYDIGEVTEDDLIIKK